VATIFDPTDRARLMGRLRGLTPEAQPRWGTFTPDRMCAHLVDALKMALGETQLPAGQGPLSWPGVKHLILYVLPMPKGVATHPALLATAGTGGPVDSHVATIERLVTSCVERGPAGQWGGHPAFGQLTGAEWGSLIYKHTDHHLRQFGL
jgi:hypothetical protein